MNPESRGCGAKFRVRTSRAPEQRRGCESRLERQHGYAELMSRILAPLIILLSLLPAVTSGAPAHKRVAHWHGYGFLPGYHQPPNNSRPVFGAKGAVTGEP